MRKLFAIVALVLALSASAQANNVTGTLKLANAQPVSNGALTFSLNQSGIVAGSFATVTSQVTCATDTNGSVVGIRNPLVAPVVAAASGGSFAANTYYVRITYYGTSVETRASPSTRILLTVNQKINVTAPIVQPSTATGYKVYVGTTSGSETLRVTVTGFGNTSVLGSESAGAVIPASNNTVCALTFNDSIIPSFTWYVTGLTLSTGNAAPGFPQNWYLQGSSVDVSNVYPLAATGQQTRFPTPVLANPSSNAQQSMNSPLTLNGYSLTAGSILLPANASPPACSGTTSLIYTDNTGALKICWNGTVQTGFLDWFSAATASVIGNQFLATSRARVDPASGTYFQTMYDSGTTSSVLVSKDYTAVAFKDMTFEGLNFVFKTNGTTSLYGKSTGLWGAGTSNPNVTNSSTYVPRLVASGNSASSGIQSIRHTTVGSLGGALLLSATRGTDANSYTIIQNGDGVGMIEFSASDGVQYIPAARIVTTVSAAPGTNDMPGTMVLQTTADGAATPTTRLTIDQAGLATFANGITSTAGTTTLGTTNVTSKRVALAKGADVASAGDLTLGTDGNLFHITGTTTINAITTANWQAGSRITLIFDASVTVKHNTAGGGGTAKMLLSGAADLSATANDTLELIFDGTSWFEFGRTII